MWLKVTLNKRLLCIQWEISKDMDVQAWIQFSPTFSNLNTIVKGVFDKNHSYLSSKLHNQKRESCNIKVKYIDFSMRESLIKKIMYT